MSEAEEKPLRCRPTWAGVCCGGYVQVIVKLLKELALGFEPRKT